MPEVILIVDDDAGDRAMLRGILSSAGHRVVEAADGEAALRQVSAGAFDVVLLDLKMPGMGGMEALRHIRQINPALPVLIMTAYATVETAVEAMKAGAYDYLSKPLDAEEVIDAVARTLARFHAEPAEAWAGDEGSVSFGRM